MPKIKTFIVAAPLFVEASTIKEAQRKAQSILVSAGIVTADGARGLVLQRNIKSMCGRQTDFDVRLHSQ